MAKESRRQVPGIEGSWGSNWNNDDAARNAATNPPLRRPGEAADRKGVAVFLVAPASACVAGQAIAVRGGTRMWR